MFENCEIVKMASGCTSETDVRDCKLTSIIYFGWGSNTSKVADSTVMRNWK
jgi:hypothetical protein